MLAENDGPSKDAPERTPARGPSQGGANNPLRSHSETRAMSNRGPVGPCPFPSHFPSAAHGAKTGGPVKKEARLAVRSGPPGKAYGLSRL